jgi:hypothetical protein
MSPLILEWRKADMIETGFAPQPGGAAVPAAVIGPPGRDGTTSHEHVQASAAATWTVNHNLGRWPAAVTVVTNGGAEIVAEVTHVTTAQLTVRFASAFAGRARII